MSVSADEATNVFDNQPRCSVEPCSSKEHLTSPRPASSAVEWESGRPAPLAVRSTPYLPRIFTENWAQIGAKR